ncbi:MAG: hypothetical protein KDK64_01195 [Chlamydiia bacterium]|nr:hypothetical protein [Chlamydiia bacterium]
MSKIVRADFRPSSISQLKKALSDEHLSFVLITCSKPSKEGKMNVEMDYNGDPALIAYLMKNAENYLT